MPRAFRTIIEPFKVKMIEPIRMTTREERERELQNAHFNLFALPSQMVLLDFLTDSGTSAMSAEQWGEVMKGDEAYAGGKSFYQLKEVVQELTGYKHFIPTHQGRAAERILFQVAVKPGQVVPSNTHFDTTRANIEFSKAEARDLPIPESLQPSLMHPFKGNMDLQALEQTLAKQPRGSVPFCLMTITNNSSGGQPVSMENIKSAASIAHGFGIPFFLDACRFAENAYFIKLREPGYQNKTVKEIAQEIFRLADGCIMSGKKDGLVNIGGFLALNNDEWAEQARNLLILTEGFPTYGGLAGRDLAAFAQGLKEVLQEDYLQYRIASVKYLGDRLTQLGIPIVQPPGGHAIYVDAKSFLDHLPCSQYPAQALAIALYLEGGVRSVEIGSVMFGRQSPSGEELPSKMELVRLAFPRRVYTQSHVDYLIEVFQNLAARRHDIPGVKMTWAQPYLRHFTAHFDLLE
ncbi:MAG TPA: tryptophanase [Bdellovibrionota bacterium]|nr:tryptophanase [Bdellovibrionota bacterium]